MFNGKQALTNVVNGSGDIDWGLMRYSGSVCSVVNTKTTGSSCTSDDACPGGQFCVSNVCTTDNNLCKANNYGGTNKQNGTGNGTCPNRGNLPTTYAGDCGSTTTNTGTAAPCNSQQVCYADTDCTGATAGSGRCALITGSAASSCTCSGAAQC